MMTDKFTTSIFIFLFKTFFDLTTTFVVSLWLFSDCIDLVGVACSFSPFTSKMVPS